MAYKGFRVRLLLRLGLLLAVAMLLLVVLHSTDWYMTVLCLGLLVFFQLYDLVQFVERTNRDISSFMEAIRYSDFTQHFATEGANQSYQELYGSFNAITDAFQRVKTEKQAHYLYLQAVVEHVGISILSFDEEGEVTLVNQVTKGLLQVPYLKNIQGLERVSSELVQALWRIGNNERTLITLEARQEQLLLTLHATELVSQGRRIKIISLQNIQPELEEQELQTWQKVIRVLTHEIMNSITPVVSLTATVSGLLEHEVIAKRQAGQAPAMEVLEDMLAGLKIVERRNAGMLHFVKNYRRLMRLPTPELRPVKVKDLLKSVHTLMQAELEAHSVHIAIYLPDEHLELLADPELLEQVLINLIKNGMEACQHTAGPRVEVMAYREEQERGRLHIEVQDNGPGIPADVLDKIFIPFYTTKKQGSGIGLSLSKQIVHLHGGSMRVSSPPGRPTVFSLLF